jgi:hypothetical protein
LHFRVLTAGGSGSGTTHMLTELLHRVSGTFQKVVLCVRSAGEPLYKYLTDKIKNSLQRGEPSPTEVFENGFTPPVGAYKGKHEQVLVIFGNLTTLPPKQQLPTVDWFTRGRKTAGGCSLVYTTQPYWRTPRTVRLNLTHTTLKRLSNKKDLFAVLRGHGSLGGDKKHTEEVYGESTSNHVDFFVVTVDGLPGEQYRLNFTQKLSQCVCPPQTTGPRRI